MNMSANKKTMAIIGGGLSGALTTISAIRQLKMNVIMIDPTPELGKGLAYQTQNPLHRLNVIAARMSLDPDQPHHFTDWLKKQSTHSKKSDDEIDHTFATRKEYGIYIHDNLNEYKNQFQWIQKKVISWKKTEKDSQQSTFKITLEDQTLLQADFLMLCTGYRSPRIPYELKPFENHQNFISDPWKITQDLSIKNLMIIGSGLTMIDQTLSILEKNPETKIISISRHGYPIQCHLQSPFASQLADANYSGLSPLATLRMIRNRIQLIGTKNWRIIIDEVRTQAQSIWIQWDLKDRKQFNKFLRPLWDTLRHRVAPEIYEKLNHYVQKGSLEFTAGKITSTDLKKFSLTIKQRKTGKLIHYKPDQVINCTGASIDQTLLPETQFLKDELNLGIKTNEWGNPILLNGLPLEQVYVVGPALKPFYWEIIAVPEIRAHLQKLITKILNQ